MNVQQITSRYRCLHAAVKVTLTSNLHLLVVLSIFLALLILNRIQTHDLLYYIGMLYAFDRVTTFV